MITILCLSGGNLVGQNVLASLHGRRSEIRLIAMNSKPDEPSLFYYDKVYLCPSLMAQPSEFELLFMHIMLEESPDLVIPCRDEDVYFLAKFTEKNPEYTSRMLCGNRVMADIMVDKEKSFEFCSRLKIPFADTIAAASDQQSLANFLNLFSYPIVAKPTRGFASHGVYLLMNEDQFNQFSGRQDYIFQRYIGNSQLIEDYMSTITQRGLPLFYSFEQTKVSIQGNIGPDGTAQGSFISLHQMTNGKSNNVVLSDRKEWLLQANEWIWAFSENGWRGPVNIQCQVDQHEGLCAYELNGRFTGATHARMLLGFDELQFTLEQWCHLQLSQHIDKSKPKLVQKSMQNISLDEGKKQTLSQNKSWP